MSSPDIMRSPSLRLTEFQDQVLDPAVHVYLPYNITGSDFLSLLAKSSADPAFTFPAFQNWLTKLLKNLKLQENEKHPYHKQPYKLREVDVQAVDWFWKNQDGAKLGFMKIQAKLETDPYWHPDTKKVEADWLPGAVFLRGGSVAMLIIIQTADARGDDEKHIILTVQPRIAAGSLAFTEIPAGMLDGGTFKGTAAREITEEAKLAVEESDLINMSKLALQDIPAASFGASDAESVECAMYPSVGACDEFIPLMLCQKRLTRRHMEWLKGKATGIRDEGENITLKLVPLCEVWKQASRDAKALAAIALYDGLKREGKISGMPEQVEAEPKELKYDGGGDE